jgi:hypothetical protein
VGFLTISFAIFPKIDLMLKNNWHLGDRPELGAMGSLNKLFRELDLKDPFAFPDFQSSKSILIGSDYSGQHSTSVYEAFGFILVDPKKTGRWANKRREIRKRYLRDGRRMSFKKLGDRRRAEALPEFLFASDMLPGLLVIFLVDSKIGSLFSPDAPMKEEGSNTISLDQWPNHIGEKLLRISHFSSLLLSGLSHKNQDVLWITDQDDVAQNIQKHTEFVKSFANISSHYLAHDLGHLRIATTASDSGSRDVEDFVSIADLAAGAVCQAMNTFHHMGLNLVQKVVVPYPTEMDQKIIHVMNWFSNQNSLLKKLVVGFEPSKESNKLVARHYSFEGLVVDP